MSAFVASPVTCSLPGIIAAISNGGSIGLVDGTTLTSNGSGAVAVPLFQMPAALRTGLTPTNVSNGVLMSIPTSSTFPQTGTITMPDGNTTASVNGLVAIPVGFAPYFANQFGFTKVA